ncbi:hypothetical protein FJT64_006005 [Amphibalanus amphitrite]|uniref:Uncharacterized protein n=1 Tax=Amphibalanus amphitrite TaxID=1232801 RepID=A0A6A4VYV2_AMPAM|nr:hypothetical protein FJT64_006005 [Amphibalanus amphitrite]
MLTGLRDLTTAEQRASLSTLLDDEWHRIVKYGLGISDTATMDEVTTAMERHLRSQRNVILDRREFYTRNQETDELFDEYLIALKEISQFCDFCTSCSDDRLRDRIVTGLHEEETDIFPRVFDTTGHLREMTGGPMRIELKDDARPTAVTAARSIPFAYRDQAKRQLDKLIEAGIIVEVHSDLETEATETYGHKIASLSA